MKVTSHQEWGLKQQSPRLMLGLPKLSSGPLCTPSYHVLVSISFFFSTKGILHQGCLHIRGAESCSRPRQRRCSAGNVCGRLLFPTNPIAYAENLKVSVELFHNYPKNRSSCYRAISKYLWRMAVAPSCPCGELTRCLRGPDSSQHSNPTEPATHTSPALLQ